MQCWYCGWDIPYELIEKIRVNQNNVCCERCCAVLSKYGNFNEGRNFKRGIDLKEIHRQWILILYRQAYGLLRKSRYTNMIREKRELKISQINRLTKKQRMTSLEQDIPNRWLDNPHINRKDFLDYHEYRQRQLCIDEIFEASFLPLFQNAIKFVYGSIVGNHKIPDFHEKIQMQIIKDLMKHYGVSINYYERGTFLYYITIFVSRYIYDLIKNSKQNPQQNEDLIEQFTKAAIFEVFSKEVNNELLNLIISKHRRRFKHKYETFQSDLAWDQIYRESFLNYIRWLTNMILDLMNDTIEFSSLQGIKRDVVENLTQTNVLGRNSRFPSEFRRILIIALSRMIYTIIATQANNMNLKLQQMELKIGAINEIVEILKSGILKNEKIRNEFLLENQKIQYKPFNEFYQDFRSELTSDKIFCACFKYSLFCLTKVVFDLVSGDHDWHKLSTFEYTIINNLRNFDKTVLNSIKFNQNSDSKGEETHERIEKGLEYDQTIEKSIFSYGESLDQAIIGIYYICEMFSKKNNFEKSFFTGNELNQILGKTHNFFKNLRKKLLNKNIIKYYGTSSRKKNSFEKGYTITKRGTGFATEIIKLKKQKFPNLFRKLILIFELRYKEYNKELMSSNKSIIIHSQKDINSELKKLAEENKVEMLTLYKSKESEIDFQCKVCQKKFKDNYYNIERRQQPRIICPICFPDLKPNIYTSMELIEKISVYSFNELSKTNFHKLSDIEGEGMKSISIIKDIVYKQIESQISEKNLEFKEHISKYVFAIVYFLAKVKLLSETNQRINISEVAKETHNKELITESHWQNITLKIIQYLRKNLEFKIRTKKHESKSLSSQKSIRSYKNLFKLINNITITYINLDLKTKIEVFYDGKCEGISGVCPFDINYKFLPALSYHHYLKGYKKKVKKKEFKYIKPNNFLNYSLAKAIKLMETQIGGLGVQCKNCHSLIHAVRYNFPIIFKFLEGISIKGIDKNPPEVLITVSRIVNEYYEQNNNSFRISKKYTLSNIKSNIKRAILRFVRKKYTIEYLFGVNYVCPICGKANINDHLNCFVAHHTNKELFENGLEKIDFGQEYDRSIEWLIENIIIQECIYICDNCHSMLHATNYRDSVLTILEDQKESKFIEDFYHFLDNKIKEKRDMILEKKEQLMKNKLRIPNPLQSTFEKGETLDKNLLCVYYITEKFSRDTQKQFFTADEFNYILAKFYRYFQAYKNELISLGYIQYIERLKKYRGSRFNKDIYHITSKGIEKAKEIKKLKLEKFPEEFKELIHTWKTRYIKYQNSTEEKEKAK